MEACREAASWNRLLRIAVNVSAGQFRRENLDVQVRKALRSGLSLARLELEITEGVLIEDVSRAKKTMHSLKSVGILIALDDFGTRYSSLSYIEAFPLDRTLGQNERSLSIVRAVMGLAQGLGVPVLAEGIETKVQMSLLVQEGCDEMQGYLIASCGGKSVQAEGPISRLVGLIGEIAAGSTKLSSAFGIEGAGLRSRPASLVRELPAGQYRENQDSLQDVNIQRPIRLRAR